MADNTINFAAAVEQQDMRMSALNEIANIGTGHAARALATICDRDFHISVPQVRPITFDRFQELVENVDDIYALVYMAVDGEFNGRMAFCMEWSSCQSLWKMLIGSAPDSAEELTEMEWSSVVEVGNIINGSFLSAFTEFTGLFSNATPPMLAIDSFGSILASIAAEASEEHVALFIETKLWDQEESVKGNFLLIPSEESVKLLWESLGLNKAA